MPDIGLLWKDSMEPDCMRWALEPFLEIGSSVTPDFEFANLACYARFLFDCDEFK